MPRNADTEVVDAGEVLVVGGGVAGLLTAVELVRRGESTTVIDSVGVGAAQSGHHHGLVHHGTLYVGNSERLVQALRLGRELWAEWLDGVAPEAPTTIVPIWDPFRVEQATRWWAERSLSFEESSTPVWLRGSPTVFSTNENAYDFTTPLRRICKEVLDGRTAQVQATRLEVAGGSLRAVHGVTEDGQRVRIVARKFVLAAGCGLLRLLRDSRLPRGRLTVRTSFMLVMEAESLPAMTLMSIEQELGGVFTGARHDGSQLRWLIGDHLSLAGSVNDSRQEARWVHATIERLRTMTEVCDGPGVRVGVYAAPKAELRDDPNDLSPFGIETYGMSNAVVITPTKLTLAPALALRCAEVVNRIEAPRGPSCPPLVGRPLEVVAERWRHVPTFPIEEVNKWFPI